MQPQLRHWRGRAVVRGAARLPLGGRGLPARRERPQVSGRTTLTSSGPSYAAVDAMATRAMTLSQLPPKILPAASANGLAELASAPTGMMPHDGHCGDHVHDGGDQRADDRGPRDRPLGVFDLLEEELQSIGRRARSTAARNGSAKERASLRASSGRARRETSATRFTERKGPSPSSSALNTWRGRPMTSSVAGSSPSGGKASPFSVQGVISTRTGVSWAVAAPSTSTARRGLATGSPRKTRWWTASNTVAVGRAVIVDRFHASKRGLPARQGFRAEGPAPPGPNAFSDGRAAWLHSSVDA